MTWLWPILSDPTHCCHEAAAFCDAIRAHASIPATTWLDLGCGGGHNDLHLKMVLVPAGAFSMGSADAEQRAGADEKPQHAVSLDALWIDRIEVSTSQYAEFLDALGAYTGACGGHDCVETKREETGTATSLKPRMGAT